MFSISVTIAVLLNPPPADAIARVKIVGATIVDVGHHLDPFAQHRNILRSAAELLSTPSDKEITGLDKTPEPDSLRLAIRDLALKWEIMDPREQAYVLTRKEDLDSDLKLLRRRYASLKDAPPLYDCMRFPDRSLVNDLVAFNRIYKEHLKAQEQLYVSDGPGMWRIHEAIGETDGLYEIWDLVRDARCDYYYITVRRDALKKLKALLGDQCFFSGSLPPCVPVWRFRRID